jgi:hypothetical protein
MSEQVLDRLDAVERQLHTVGAVLLIAGFLYQHLGESRAKEIAGNGI